MTFAGKILVIVIMAMSLVFLGISTVALTTATDWKKAIADQSKANQEIDGQLQKAVAERDAFKGKHDVAQKEHAAAAKPIENQIVALKAEDKQGRDAILKGQETLLQHQSETKTALEDASNKNKDIIQLRTEDTAIAEQAKKFKTRQEEIDAEITNLRRMLDAAKTNASQITKSH
jgi:chromosome segregation ATPase